MFGTNAVDSLTGKSGRVGVPSISAQKRYGRVVGYSVYLGTQGELRRQRRFFVHRDDAERFVAKHTATPIPIGELWERKAEILYALERLRPFGTNLTDAVKIYPRGLSDIHAGPFYRRNGLSPGGHVSIGSWGGG